jgi:hypothetical protein
LKWGREAIVEAEKAGRVMQEGTNQGTAGNGLIFEWRIKKRKNRFHCYWRKHK